MKRASLRRLNRKSALHRKSVLRRKAVALAVSSALMGLTGNAWGQAVTGTIEGTVPVASGEAIRITDGAGYDRTIKVGASVYRSRMSRVYPFFPERGYHEVQHRLAGSGKPRREVRIDGPGRVPEP